MAPDPMDLLHPGLVHHVVNTLGWPRLRTLQEEAITPLTDGADAVLIAPTAGGKTEAACFPLLSRMAQEKWEGTSVLYVCPLKALLNNLLPRLETYTSWLGRTAALWHGDVTHSCRKRILRERPDVLLTTPESLEAMLVSANVDHRAFFSGLRAIVVDEVHAFAGDDRGGIYWPYWNDWSGWPGARCSGSVCPRRWATRRSCSPGCREQRPGGARHRSSPRT